MRLAHPWALSLALPALAAALWHARRLEARRPRLPYPAAQGLPEKLPLKARLARRGPLALKVSALILLIVGAARPQRASARLRGLGRGIDIVLALDVSLSMGALDFAPSNRLDAAKNAALRFIRGRAQDRIGLVVFGGAPLLACPLTLDFDAVAARLSELQPAMTGVDGTAVGDGLVSALNRLKGSDAKSKVVILLTDGRSNTGAVDPLTAAKAAASMGVRVYTIGTAKRGAAMMPIPGPTGPTLVRIEDDLDEDLLSEIARITDGRYFRAEDPKALREIYARIDALEKSEVKLPDIVSHADLYSFPVAAAALLLLAEAALANTLWLRWP